MSGLGLRVEGSRLHGVGLPRASSKARYSLVVPSSFCSLQPQRYLQAVEISGLATLLGVALSGPI